MAAEIRHFDADGNHLEVTEWIDRRRAEELIGDVSAAISKGRDVCIGRPAGVSFAERYAKTRPVVRAIEYKKNPSKHECNAKCINGSCNGVCECRCGSKNHGIGKVA